MLISLAFYTNIYSQIDRVHGELLCTLSTSIFSVCVLFISIFLNDLNQTTNWDDGKSHLVQAQLIKNSDINNNTERAMSHKCGLNRLHLDRHFFENSNVRPLIFLCGAKLLSTFCSNIPFIFITFNYFDVLHYKYKSNDYIMYHLLALFTARIILGALAMIKGNLNRKIIRFMIKSIVIVMVCNLFIYIIIRTMKSVQVLFDYKHMIGGIIINIYVLSAICMDSLSHVMAISQSSYSFFKRPLIITFATCIEHLIYILFIVIYLAEISNSILFIFTFLFIGVTILFQVAIENLKINISIWDESNRNFAKFKNSLSIEIL